MEMEVAEVVGEGVGNGDRGGGCGGGGGLPLCVACLTAG